MSKLNLELNEAQNQAVTSPLGVQLVLAGAGSGKTQVLVQRIGFLVDKLNCHPSSILAVTFTNKAAKEMQERISSLLNGNIEGMWVGTFHGFAHRLLRRHYQEANLAANFQILDASDQKRLIKTLLTDSNLPEKDFSIREVASFINHNKDDGIRAENIQTYAQDFHQHQLKKIYQAYEKACIRSNVIDFAEILLRALELLRNNKKLLELYQQRFQHILVDEFQDTNSVQYAWLRLIASKNKSLMVVGDDDQSIYGWRGAKIENIQNFHHDFKNCVTIRLEQNYRSSGVILAAANAVIAQNGISRLGKQLWTSQAKGEKIQLYSVADETKEAQKVAQKIETLQKNGTKLNDIAILYRTNAQSRALEESLKKQRIAYRIYGDLSFYDRAEVKNAIAYLAVMNNPHNNPALERIINFPPRGIGSKSIDLMRQISNQNGSSLWDAITKILQDKQLPSRTYNALLMFHKAIVKLQNLLQENQDKMSLATVIRTMLENGYSGLIRHYEAKKEDKPKERVANIKELISAASNFTEGLKDKPLTNQLQNFIDQSSLFNDESNENEDEDYVHLMTVHRAKGLEFAHVFITGLEEDIFPLPYYGDDKKLEEERRLFYVALTRAKLTLSLYYATERLMYGRREHNEKSRFIKEIPDNLIASTTQKKQTFKEVDRSFSIRKVSPKGSDYEKQKQDKYRLGSSIYHQELGSGLIFKVDGNKIELKFGQQRIWLDKDDPNLKFL